MAATSRISGVAQEFIMVGPNLAVISDALAAAVRAPSPCNTQPWRFEVHGHRIDLLLDRDRVLTVADPEAREARLACGAALCNLRVSIRAHSRVPLVDVLPDRDRPDLLASVRIAGERSATVTEVRLAEAIAKRHTNRHPFLDREVPARARGALAAAARAEGARLELLHASERYDVVAELIRTAEYLQEQDPAYQRELEQWIGASDDRRDGVPITAQGPAPDAEGLLAVRRFSHSEPLPVRRFEQQPLLAAVLTSTTGPRSDLRAGAGMQHVLLTACDQGLSASFLSQPFEVASTRLALAEEFHDDGEIHTLLRVGYGYPVAVTPRRPVEDVATHVGSAPVVADQPA